MNCPSNQANRATQRSHSVRTQNSKLSTFSAHWTVYTRSLRGSFSTLRLLIWRTRVVGFLGETMIYGVERRVLKGTSIRDTPCTSSSGVRVSKVRTLGKVTDRARPRYFHAHYTITFVFCVKRFLALITKFRESSSIAISSELRLRLICIAMYEEKRGDCGFRGNEGVYLYGLVLSSACGLEKGRSVCDVTS